MKLPDEFAEKFSELLGENEYALFADSFNQSRSYGIRVNTLKISTEEFEKISPFELEKIPWSNDGYYIKEDDNPGKHPYYHAGLYYIQEPSAMLPGKIVEAKEGEKILDLCAAPGGKTVQVAANMNGEGVLVSNDINRKRISALMKNIELYGISNAVITNEDPNRLSNNFNNYFDKILIDAPCSGEGMFRKDKRAVSSWGKYKSEECVSIQREILEYAYNMLKDGGYIIYSTCTYNPDENERVLEEFMQKHSDVTMVEIEKKGGVEGGRTAWTLNNTDMSKAARLWPHKLRGEGHFAAKMKKGNIDIEVKSIQRKELFTDNNKELEPFNDFLSKYSKIKNRLNGEVVLKNGKIHLIKENIPLRGLNVSKAGLYIGDIKNNRFVPSHSFLLSLNRECFDEIIDFELNDINLQKYLKGETIFVDGNNGYIPIAVNGYLLGWGKQQNGQIKNMYPRGWTLIKEY